ncbi:MAG TPA: YigZ family protein [Firmicutes bacterium]|nr:YigZ family protein [Bacillota bacterium]
MGSYRTAAQAASVELKIEKSRFIGYAAPTPDDAAVQAFLADLRREHRRATHVCFAYRLGDGPGAVIYFSDHGEPAGTAGKPILGAILRRDLTDVTVVVVRYFGGRKLGVRGLIEAYGTAAGAALEAAGVEVRRRMVSLRVACAHPRFSALNRLIQQSGGEVSSPAYDARQASAEVRVPVEAEPALRAALAALPAEILD